MRGYEYARDVTEGRIVSCKWTRLACQRQLDDLERWKDDGPYRFDVAKANKNCAFLELLPHVKGRWAREGLTITLEPWMCFIHSTVYGWVHRKTGLRRFRAAYEEMARKNAKSTRLSGNSLYHLSADNEAGCEVYSAATTRDQARIVFQIGQMMARKSPEMQRELGVNVHAHALSSDDGGTFQALSADAHTLDGLNPSFAAIDELHAHRTRGVYDVLESGQGSRDQPLLWSITTAGSDRSGICYEVRDYICKILEGVVEDDTYFGIIYTIDEDDNWRDEACWQKANPNLGVSVEMDYLRRLARKASEMPAALANFLTKNLSVWVNADMAWMDMTRWADSGDSSLDMEDFTAHPCYIGIDLASRNDIAAMALLFVGEQEVDGRKRRKYTLFSKHWLPEAAIEAAANSQYVGWVISGNITETPGNTIDFAYIEDELLDICSRFDVREVAYDPFQATQFSQRMVEQGLPMVELRPTVLNMSEPMKELQALVLDGDIEHPNDPCLTWQVSNVVAHLDRKDNIYPRKERPENKIDAVVATISALARAMLDDSKPSVYERRGVRMLEA